MRGSSSGHTARAAGWLALLATASLAVAAPAQGAPAPDFTLTDLSGQSLQLSKLRGKAVVLDFFATWCGPCRDELPKLIALQRRYQTQGVQVVGVSLDDSAEPVHQLVRELHVPYPVVLGDEKLAERFGGILGLPALFVIDRDGRIVAKHEGDTSADEAADDVQRMLSTHR